MLTAAQIGAFSLNISFVLYLVVYLPQIIHNRKEKYIQDLSIMMHINLYFGYFFDLFYGFAHALPWQYKTVSIVGLSLLMLQNLQLMHYAWFKSKQTLYITLAILLISLMVFGYVLSGPKLTATTIDVLGYISRLCFISYLLPQLLKNHRLQSAYAISPIFVLLNLILAVLDLISSWCLHWGWPNQLGAPITLMMMLILWRQVRGVVCYPV
jgi:uncharacterized protein with PQ loop repeat